MFSHSRILLSIIFTKFNVRVTAINASPWDKANQRLPLTSILYEIL